MRYTTVIDISEMPSVYRNVNVRLLYFHMVLKSGWHDIDRDLLPTSIRRLAADVGLSISAVRHALHVLETAGLIQRNGEVYHVKKWILEQTVTPRPKNQRQQKQLDLAAERRQQEEARQRELEIERIRREQNFNSGKTDFMIYYEEQLAKAQAGDMEASRVVKRNAAVYESHKAKMKQQ